MALLPLGVPLQGPGTPRKSKVQSEALHRSPGWAGWLSAWLAGWLALQASPVGLGFGWLAGSWLAFGLLRLSAALGLDSRSGLAFGSGFRMDSASWLSSTRILLGLGLIFGWIPA